MWEDGASQCDLIDGMPLVLLSMMMDDVCVLRTVAAEKARSNSFLSPAMVRETIVFVTDVPMLDPKMIGTASCGLRTEKLYVLDLISSQLLMYYTYSVLQPWK